jgi:hypothetical protein
MLEDYQYSTVRKFLRPIGRQGPPRRRPSESYGTPAGGCEAAANRPVKSRPSMSPFDDRYLNKHCYQRGHKEQRKSHQRRIKLARSFVESQQQRRNHRQQRRRHQNSHDRRDISAQPFHKSRERSCPGPAQSHTHGPQKTPMTIAKRTMLMSFHIFKFMHTPFNPLSSPQRTIGNAPCKRRAARQANRKLRRCRKLQ